MIFKRYIDFPTALEEFTPKQFLKWVSLILRFESGDINHHDLKTELATYLVKRKIRKKDLKEPFVSSQIFRLTEHLHFLFEEKEKEDKIELHPAGSIKNLLPRIKHYYGPADALRDITFLEYIHAYQYYREFIIDKDVSKLNDLAAVLYRRKRFFFFGKRMKYNAEQTEGRAGSFAKMPREVKFAIFYFFKSCDNYLREAKIFIAGNEIDFGILFASSNDDESKEDDGLGMLGVLYKLAETGVFGNIKEASNQNFWDVLLKLYQNRKDYLIFKSKQQKK